MSAKVPCPWARSLYYFFLAGTGGWRATAPLKEITSMARPVTRGAYTLSATLRQTSTITTPKLTLCGASNPIRRFALGQNFRGARWPAVAYFVLQFQDFFVASAGSCLHLHLRTHDFCIHW